MRNYKKKKPHLGTIYQIRNKLNGKIYVGCTQQRLKDRWTRHCSSCSPLWRLRNDIRKFGKESFEMTTLYQSAERGDLLQAERFYILALGALGSYNRLQCSKK